MTHHSQPDTTTNHQRAVEDAVAELDGALRAHAGGIELVESTPDGAVNLRFTGMCTGCPMRPLTTAATVRPRLLEVAGVADIRIEGSRISEFAERRLLEAFTDGDRDGELCARTADARTSGGPRRSQHDNVPSLQESSETG